MVTIREKYELALLIAKGNKELNCHVKQIESKLKSKTNDWSDSDQVWVDYFCHHYKIPVDYDVSNNFIKEMVEFLEKESYILEQDASKGNGIPYTLYWRKGEIVLWTEGTKISELWFNDGRTAVGGFKGKPVKKNVLNEIESLIGKKICSKCWDIYKTKNKGTCSRCGKSHYNCYC